MEEKKVAAVVVTYNRKVLLMECLDSLLSQTYPVDSIVLIDNASTDGTYEELSSKGYIDNEKINYIKMKKNTGGAGGFYEGLKRVRDKEYDWVWIMDDDTIPTETCLEKLLAAHDKIKNKDSGKQVSFLASAVYGMNGEFMNLPTVSKKVSDNGYEYWYEHLKDGIVNISDATFVSILVNKQAIEKCGLPCKDYFIWGDDTEYTTRLTRYFGDAYFVGDSVAIHKRINAKNLSIDNEEDIQRMEMYRYLFRNRAINQKYYDHYTPWKEVLISFLSMIKNFNDKKRFARRRIMLKGTWEGIVEYKKFKAYIDSQLKRKK